MNIWLKSFAIGSIVNVGLYFISSKKRNAIVPPKYTLHCTIKAMPDSNSRHSFSLQKITKLLEKRLEDTWYEYEISYTEENNISVSLFEMTDTISPFNMLISDGRVQFREMYHSGELLNMLKAVADEIERINIAQEKNIVAPQKDSLSKEVSALLDKMESEKRKQEVAKRTEPLIEFTEPYMNPQGFNVFPPQVGAIKLKDTAAIRKLFQLSSIKEVSRPDIELFFGQPESGKGKNRDTWYSSVYFLKKIDRQYSVALENEDVENAEVRFSTDGHPGVTFQFNKIGTTKWAYLTRKNINRPIAMVVNGNVISAPNVLSPIENGNSEITGNFTLNECHMLSIALKSSKLPAKLSIVNSSKKQEKRQLISLTEFLILFMCFGLCTGLAFFTFKTLKAT